MKSEYWAKKWIVNNEGLKIMNNAIFFNELKQKLMNTE